MTVEAGIEINTSLLEALDFDPVCEQEDHGSDTWVSRYHDEGPAKWHYYCVAPCCGSVRDLLVCDRFAKTLRVAVVVWCTRCGSTLPAEEVDMKFVKL